MIGAQASGVILTKLSSTPWISPTTLCMCWIFSSTIIQIIVETNKIARTTLLPIYSRLALHFKLQKSDYFCSFCLPVPRFPSSIARIWEFVASSNTLQKYWSTAWRTEGRCRKSKRADCTRLSFQTSWLELFTNFWTSLFKSWIWKDGNFLLNFNKRQLSSPNPNTSID